MKKEDWKRTLAGGMSTFVALAMAIVLYFVLSRFSQIQGVVSWMREILTPFMYGGIFAYLLKSPCNYLEIKFQKWLPKRYKKRAGGLAMLVVVALAVSCVWLLLAAILPELIDSIIRLIGELPDQIDRFTAWLSSLLDGDGMIYDYLNNVVNQVSDQISLLFENDLGSDLNQLMSGFAATLTTIVGLIYDLFVGIIVCVYVLGSRKIFARQGRQIVYAAVKQPFADKLLDELRFADRTFTGFFAGKILDSTVVGVVTYVFCMIMTFVTKSFPNPILISVVIGVTNIIPYFGPFIGAIPCFVIIYISNPVSSLIFAIFILCLQQIDGNIIGPKLLANSVGLSAFWVLFSITLFGGLFGLMGIIIGVPTFAVIYDLIRRIVVKQLNRRGMSELAGEGSMPQKERGDTQEEPEEEPENKM